MSDINLSIIIPVYNLQDYISNCLESIISQIDNVKDKIEIVIIDDGSKDNSLSICREYEKKYDYIKCFHQENSGVSVARNNGLKKANGKYIWFVDGDDFITPDSISKIINEIKSENGSDIITGGFVKTFNGKLPKFCKVSQKKENFIKNISNQDYPQNLISIFEKGLFTPSLWGNIIKKEIFIKNNIFLQENVKYTEDMDCTLRLFVNAKTFFVIPSPIYVYRQNRKSSATSNISLKRVKDTFNFVLNWLEVTKDEKIPESFRKQLLFFVKYQYSIVVAMMFLLEKNDFLNMYDNVKKYEYLLSDGKGKKGKMVNYSYKLLGFDNTGKLMARWIKR